MLAYHEFGSHDFGDIYKLSPSEFREHVRAIQEVSLGASKITFDDGHLSQFRHAAPILKEFGMNGLFFITTAWVGFRPEIMQWSHIRELHALGHQIGAHGYTHTFLTNLSPLALRAELQKAKEMTEDKLGTIIDSISMPGGRINQSVLDACSEAGYQFIYTSRPVDAANGLKIPEHGSEREQVIGRLIVRRGMSPMLLQNFISGKRSTLRRINFEYTVKQQIKHVLGDSLYQVLWSRLLRGKSISMENVQVS